MGAVWDEAIQRVKEEPPLDHEALLRDELSNLWSDLDEAMNRAINGRWSMQCDWLTERIVTLTRFAGATPWEQVPTTLLLNGNYQGIMTAAGFHYPPPDLNEIRRLVAG